MRQKTTGSGPKPNSNPPMKSEFFTKTRLTLDPDPELLAGGGRDAVGGDAQVVAHVQPADLGKPQLGALDDGD